MRPNKLSIVSATMLAYTSLAGVAFADNTTPPATTGGTGASGSTGSVSGGATGGAGTSAVTSQTVMTPSSPSVSTTSTNITTQGTPGGAATTPSATTPTSTTTTTSADDATAASSAPITTISPPPSGESTVVYNHQRPNKALLITGASLFVGTYVTTAAFAGANGPVADKDLYLPIVGPWINLSERTTASGRANDTRDVVLIAGSGVLQGAGAALLVTSFFVPERVPAARISAGNVKMQITPQAGPGAGGLGAVGTF
ncbi:MAG: hypothetical protein QOI41_2755 [Myxococcales bacterium]|nr:hypothetical protein [Myxococcales bacterium]